METEEKRSVREEWRVSLRRGNRFPRGGPRCPGGGRRLGDFLPSFGSLTCRRRLHELPEIHAPNMGKAVPCLLQHGLGQARLSRVLLRHQSRDLFPCDRLAVLLTDVEQDVPHDVPHELLELLRKAQRPGGEEHEHESARVSLCSSRDGCSRRPGAGDFRARVCRERARTSSETRSAPLAAAIAAFASSQIPLMCIAYSLASLSRLSSPEPSFTESKPSSSSSRSTTSTAAWARTLFFPFPFAGAMSCSPASHFLRSRLRSSSTIPSCFRGKRERTATPSCRSVRGSRAALCGRDRGGQPT